MITSQGRYEPSAGARISLWPTEQINARGIYDSSCGNVILSLAFGSTEVLLFDQIPETLEVLGHAIIRLAEEQRRATARLTMAEPLQEK